MDTQQVVDQFDIHPQLAWDLLDLLKREWFLGPWRQRQLSYSWNQQKMVKGGVPCWTRHKAGPQPSNPATRIEFIDAKGQWRWGAGRWVGVTDHLHAGGFADTLEEAMDAADRALVSMGARLIDDGSTR